MKMWILLVVFTHGMVLIHQGGLWQSILTNPHDDFRTRQNKVNEILMDFPLKINSLNDCESIIGDFAFTHKIYKKSFLEKNSIDFPEGIIAEDSVFLLNALLNANGIKYINKIVYHYYHERIDVDNPSVSYIHSKKYLKSLLDAFYKLYYLSLEKSKSKIFKEYLLFQKLEYFLNSRLLKSNLSVSDVLDLLIYSSPLFKLCGDVNSNLANLYEYIANKDYENALQVIFGEDILNQKDIKVISNVNYFKDDCNLIELQSNSWSKQFESEKPDLFIFKDIENEEMLKYCKVNDIETISINGNEKDFRQLLDSINFKYIPYLKHIVVFYELDDLRQINNIHKHFYSISYPFKHFKLITSKDNLFLSNSILKSDLEKLDFDGNYYFCFADLSIKTDLIKNELINFSSKENRIVFNSSSFKKLIKTFNKPTISVIVPVYNVENYLKECLDSICNQSFRDIEIICVNDGSEDNSLNILKEYKRLDSRISIISKENGGLASARNVGLNQAKGKYVYFIDSDDYLNQNALKECYELSKKKMIWIY